MVKSYNKCYISVFFLFFILVKPYSISPICLQSIMKKALFILITCLMTLSLEKEIIGLEKSVEKVLKFGSKNLREPCVMQWERHAKRPCVLFIQAKILEVLFRNEMNWTISVWADFNISVNFYPLVLFISIFSPSTAASYLTSTIWKTPGNLCANPPPPIFIPN